MKRKTAVLVLALTALVLAGQGARYLIITADVLAPSIQPLADWKQVSGMSSKIARLSQVGTDTTAIKNYIRTAYNTWEVKPEFVLLVGSPNLLPSRLYREGGHGGYSYSTDNLYGDINGDGLMDIPVGRFPAKSTAQLDVMVAKTLAYERKPDLTDTLWMRRMTTVCRDAGDDDAHVYWGDIRNAAQLAGDAGFVGVDSFASARGNTAANVVSSVTRGTGLVLYRGTATGNWYDPFKVDPAQTANNRKLPVILSITCETVTLTPGESMVGEAWLKAGTTTAPKGAVAFFGNTNSGSDVAVVRSAVARGFFQGLFVENKYKLGHAMIRAKEQLRAEFPTRVSDYRGFTVLGDPDLAIWTALPRRLDVFKPETILPRTCTLEIGVEHKGMPVAGAFVCASMGTSVYACGLTDSTGLARLQVTPTDTGLMRLVVTGQNCCPYETTILVSNLVGIEDSPRPNPAGRTFLRAAPSTFRGSTVLSWPAGTAASVDIYNASGSLVRSLTASRVHNGTSTAVWDGRDQHGRALPPGLYFCSIPASVQTMSARSKVTRLN